MNNLTWNQENICNLGKVFLQKVRYNMRKDTSIVRFGETGTGIQPNYQVTFENGQTMTRRGSSHERYESADEFNDKKISQHFTYEQIDSAYHRA